MLERVGRRLAGSVLFWDILATLGCLAITPYLRLGLPFGRMMDADHPYVQPAWQLYVGAALIWTIIFLLLRPQHVLFTRSLIESAGVLLASVALASLSFAGMLYLSPFREFSRLQFGYFVALNVVLLLALHLAARAYIRAHSQRGGQHRVLLVGQSLAHQPLLLELYTRRWAGVHVVGCASDCLQPQEDTSLRVLGKVEDTVRLVQQHAIDEVIFALPAHEHHRVLKLALDLQPLPVMVHMVPNILDLTFAQVLTTTVGGIPLLSLNESALTDSQRMLKRLFDIAASGLLLVVLTPLLVLIALLIRLGSPGPIFFRQERIGEHGRRFAMIKFRSMYADSEQRWHEVAQRDLDGNLIHKTLHDPRITPIGRLLRRTSLDELPQLLNVLRGEMSLVGPRPEMPYVAAEYQPWQWQRFRVPPGITGWWQVNGRSDKPMHLHTEDDLYYVQNYSFWLDVQILFKTVIIVLRGHGAY